VAITEHLLGVSEHLEKFQLLALRALGIHHGQAVERALGDLVRVGIRRRLLARLLRGYGDHTICLYIAHPPPRALRTEVSTEPVEVDIVSDVEADMHGSGIGRARQIMRTGETVDSGPRRLPVMILEKLDDHVVELDKANIQPLRSAAQVWNADRFRID